MSTNIDKVNHTQEFTDIERQTLRVWFDVDDAGNDALADAVLNAGLNFEHYTSLLPDAPGDRTPEQLATQSRMAFILSEQLSLAEAFLQSQGVRKPTAAQFRAALAPLADVRPQIREGSQ